MGVLLMVFLLVCNGLIDVVTLFCLQRQIHVHIQRKKHWRSIPVALFLQLLPRLAASSRPVSLWRTCAVFAARGAANDAIVELELCGGDLHVRGCG